MKQLDKYTLGKTPAAIYLIEFLNTQGTFKDRNVLKFINDFRSTLQELANAVYADEISIRTLTIFCELKRVQLDVVTPNYYASGIDPLVVDLLRNIILGDIKKYTRMANKFKSVNRSLISVARNHKLNVSDDEYQIDIKGVTVVIDENNQAHTDLRFKDIEDEVTPEVLQERSKRKLERLGKPSTLY